MLRILFLSCCLGLLCCAAPALADPRNDPREQALSDSLDLWREGRYEQLYGTLSHRSALTRERFVQAMQDTDLRPACCFTKLRDFRLITENRTTAKVYARIGMEGVPGTDGAKSREFTLDHEEGSWKMRLNDLKALAGIKSTKKN
ncbi:MAG: hypothetical protein WBI04_04800 [Trichlorobacter sp.]|jgi:hypothetical protein